MRAQLGIMVIKLKRNTNHGANNMINLATTTETKTFTYNKTQESFFADPNTGDEIVTVVVDASLDADEIDALLAEHLFASDVAGIVATSEYIIALSTGYSATAGNLNSVSSS